MTIYARQVLGDCKAGLQDLTDDISGSEWRRKWVACVALLRAVGHVLDKVDRNVTTAMNSVIQEEWRRFKNDTIFKDFIEQERNNILKQYKFGAGQGVTIQVGTLKQTPIGQGGNAVSGVEASTPTASFNTYLMNTGPYSKADPRDIVKLAIAWWEQQLDEIDKRASSP